MMLILLAIMTLCLCWIRSELFRVEQEIQAVEDRAIERENHLLAARATNTAADIPEVFILDELVVPEAVEVSEEPEPEPEPEPAMAPWPDEETEYILKVLTHEAGCDELLCGCVAQALYNACEIDGWQHTPAEMMRIYRYASPLDWYSEEAAKAYDDVFLSGVVYEVIENSTMFYAPKYGWSSDHECQRFVVEVNGVKFFEKVM